MIGCSKTPQSRHCIFVYTNFSQAYNIYSVTFKERTDFFVLFEQPWSYECHLLVEREIFASSRERLAAILRKAFEKVAAILEHESQVTLDL